MECFLGPGASGRHGNAAGAAAETPSPGSAAPPGAPLAAPRNFTLNLKETLKKITKKDL